MNRKEIVNCPEYKAANAALRYWHSLPDEVRKWIINLDQEPDVIDAYEEGVLYGWNNPNWISVEERLPEETEVVLGVREGGTDVEMYKFMGFNESTNTFDWEWHPYYRAVVDDVTHWMPIVPPRKEE